MKGIYITQYIKLFLDLLFGAPERIGVVRLMMRPQLLMMLQIIRRAWIARVDFDQHLHLKGWCKRGWTTGPYFVCILVTL